MKHFGKAGLLAVLVTLGVTSFVLGMSMSTNGGRFLDPPLGRVFVQMVGPGSTSTTAPTGTDSLTSPVKTAGVHKITLKTPNDVSSGAAVAREFDVLYRVQENNGSVYIDFVFDATITSLSNTVAAMDLLNGPSGNPQTMQVGHPSPTKDKVDTQALVSAGGS